MPDVTDWLALWSELSEVQETVFKASGEKDSDDIWRKRAKHFDSEIKRRWTKSDSSREFITSKLKANPRWTVLDIGGGTGAWACLMAQYAKQVTVVEPSPAMNGIMQKNLVEANILNVEILKEEWPKVAVEKHDLVLCSHAMYGFPDFELFIRSLEAASDHLCVLIMRAPDPKGVMSIAARHILGHPYDSPNYQVGFNALLQLGIFPNVLMEDTGLWDPWTSPCLEEALFEAKRRLRLSGNREYDDYLLDLLKRNLVHRDEKLFWPKGIRSALVYWHVNKEIL